jgi:hypothetical protein
MAETTKQYRVKPGKELAHDGGVKVGGADVEIRTDIAHEIRHLVDEVQPDGTVKPIGHAEAEASVLEQELASAQPHERVSILQAARDAVAARLTTLDAAIAAEDKAEKDAKAALAAKGKPAAAKPAADKPAEAPKG